MILKKGDLEIIAALEQTPPLNKRWIGNAKTFINVAVFNRINTVTTLRGILGVTARQVCRGFEEKLLILK